MSGRIRRARWNAKNRAVLAESNAWYRAKRMGRLAPWAAQERAQIRELYREADRRTWDELVRYEVDHWSPLRLMEDVCGLHCLANLRIIERRENRVVWSISLRKPIRLKG